MKVKFATFFLIIVSIFIFQSAPVIAANPPFYDDLNVSSVLWTYQKIFAPSDIPLPDSARGLNGANVKAVYSPSVIKFQNQYLMFFGVSIFCYPNGQTVARDSIALAISPDNKNWTFGKYIIEPDPSACQKPMSEWSDNMTFEVNDPSVQINPNNSQELVVFFTTVIWPNDNFGHIGIARFDANLNQTFRNDKYLRGGSALGGPGYSRPDVQWLSPTSARLWFDSGGIKIGSVPIDNYTQLTNSPIYENIGGVGGDVNLPLLDYQNTLLLLSGITATSRSVNSTTWSPIWRVTQISGQGWDRSGQGSPDFYLDRTSCTAKLFFAGVVLNGSGDYESLSIGVAEPPAGKVFNFPICQSVSSSPIGWLDSASCSSIDGWSGDKDNPNASNDVDIYANGPNNAQGGTFVGTTTANTIREKAVCDALGSTQSPCPHGFVFNTPASLKDNQPHSIYAYGINLSNTPGTNVLLSGSPKTITCSSPYDINGDGKVDILDLARIVNLRTSLSVSVPVNTPEDLDSDLDVDETDLRAFLAIYTHL